LLLGGGGDLLSVDFFSFVDDDVFVFNLLMVDVAFVVDDCLFSDDVVVLELSMVGDFVVCVDYEVNELNLIAVSEDFIDGFGFELLVFDWFSDDYVDFNYGILDGDSFFVLEACSEVEAGLVLAGFNFLDVVSICGEDVVSQFFDVDEGIEAEVFHVWDYGVQADGKGVFSHSELMPGYGGVDDLVFGFLVEDGGISALKENFCEVDVDDMLMAA